MNETFSTQQTSPFPEGPSESARAPSDPLEGDWAEGMRASAHEIAIRKPRRLSAIAADAHPESSGAKTANGARPAHAADGASAPEVDASIQTEQLDLRSLDAMRAELDAKTAAPAPFEVEAPEAWASAEEDQLASLPPPPRNAAEHDGSAHHGDASGEAGERKDEVMLLSDAELAEGSEEEEVVPASEPPLAPALAAPEPHAQTAQFAEPAASEPHDGAASPQEHKSDPGRRSKLVDATTLSLLEQAHSEAAQEAEEPAAEEPAPVLLDAGAELHDGEDEGSALLLSPESALPDEPQEPGEPAAEPDRQLSAEPDAAQHETESASQDEHTSALPPLDATSGEAKAHDPWSAAFEEAAASDPGQAEPFAADPEPAVAAPEPAPAPVPTPRPKPVEIIRQASDPVAPPKSHPGIPAEPSPSDQVAPWSSAPLDPLAPASADLFSAGASDPFSELVAGDAFAAKLDGSQHEPFAEVTSLGAALPAPAAESSPWQGPSTEGEIDWAPALSPSAPADEPVPPAVAAFAAAVTTPSTRVPLATPRHPSSPGAKAPSWADPATWDAKTVHGVVVQSPEQPWTPADAEWTTAPSAPVPLTASRPGMAGHAGAAFGSDDSIALEPQAGGESPFATLKPGESLAGEDEPRPEEIADLNTGDMQPLPDDAELLSPLDELHEPAEQPAQALKLAGEHRVAVQTRGGGTKRGLLRDADLGAQSLSLHPSSGAAAPEKISSGDVKAIFFMLAPGERNQPGSGRRVKITFTDGRTLEGDREGGEAREGFFIVPADASRTNTKRIYVARAALLEIVDA